MSEQQPAQNSSTQDGQATSEATSGAGDEQKQIIMTPKQLAERLERAKPADYEALKAKAEKFDELDAANKSDIEKANERAVALERERDQVRAEALRWKVAAKHGITDDDAELFLTGTDEQTLTKQAERLAERVNDRRKQGNHVPREGNNPRPKEDDRRAFADFLTGNRT